MSEQWIHTIENELLSWPGVSKGQNFRGGLQFNLGRIELGHVHGHQMADLPFTRKIRDELIAQDKASVHDPLPNSGWVRRWIHSSEDVTAVIELFRLNYERATARGLSQTHSPAHARQEAEGDSL